MKKTEMEVLSTTTNAPVLRFPGRKFPGILIQGDSLWNLYRYAQSLAGTLSENGGREEAAEMAEILRAYLLQYEAALAAHGVERPYHGQVK